MNTSNIGKIKVPQFDSASGSLNIVKLFINVAAGFIAMIGLYGALSGNIKGMGFYDGLGVIGVGFGFYLAGILLFKYGFHEYNVVFYPDKIEMETLRGNLYRSFSKENILFISAYEIIAGAPVVISHIPFEALAHAASKVNTFSIYIETEPWKEYQEIPNIRGKDAIFLHNNPEARIWVQTYFRDKIKNPGF